MRTPRHALVLGGTGAVGGAVVEALARANVPATFTWWRSEARAAELSGRTGARAERVDLSHPGAMIALFAALEARDTRPDVAVHAAAVPAPAPLLDLTLEDWQRVLSVNATSALTLCQQMGRRTAPGSEAHVVLVSALDRAQSLPIPAAFAATQGLLGALAMGAAKELAPRGVRVNVVALGPLGQGLSQSLDPAVLEDFRTFSALRRFGTPAEAADAIVWLALENTYMNGKVLPVNGGL